MTARVTGRTDYVDRQATHADTAGYAGEHLAVRTKGRKPTPRAVGKMSGTDASTRSARMWCREQNRPIFILICLYDN